MSDLKKLVFALLLAVFLILTLKSWLDPFDDRRFDRSDWLASDFPTRAGMADDLIATQLPEGMQRTDVLHMLGEPQRVIEGPFESVGVKYSNPITFRYDLGCWSGVAEDTNFIYIQFDSEDSVTAATLTGY